MIQLTRECQQTRLWQKGVLITRPKMRASSWVEAFSQAGADVYLLPTNVLQAVQGNDKEQAVQTISTASTIEPAPWLVFTSVPAVEFCFSIMQDSGRQSVLTNFKVAAVGPSTARSLSNIGLAPDIVGDVDSYRLANLILKQNKKESGHASVQLYHPASSLALSELSECIRSAGGSYESVLCYHNEANAALDLSTIFIDECEEANLPWDKKQIGCSGKATHGQVEAKAKVDLLTFASPSAIQAIVEKASAEELSALQSLPALAIGQTTLNKLKASGFAKSKCAKSTQAESVIRASIDLLGL